MTDHARGGFDAAAFLAESPLVPVAMHAASGRVSFVGPQARMHLGRDAADWRAETFWLEHILPDDQAAVIESRQRLAERGGRHSIDYRMEHADGRVVWTLETVQAVDRPHGVQLEGFLQDITDRKRQELLLWKSEERLRAILRSAPDAMVITDPDGLIVEMNDQAEALFDYRRADVVGSSIDHLVPSELRSRMAGLRDAFANYPERASLIDGHGVEILRGDGTQVALQRPMSPGWPTLN